MFKDITVILDDSPDDTAFIAAAGAFAERHAAHLTLLQLSLIPTIVLEPAYLELQHYMAGSDSKADRLMRQASEFGCATRVIREEEVALLADLAVACRATDLVVLGPPSVYRQPRLRERAARAIALQSGRPLVSLAGAEVRLPLRRIVIGWNGSREATRALHDALPLVVTGGRVEVAMMAHPLPPAGRLREAAADIAAHLARRGFAVEKHEIDTDGAHDAGPLVRFVQDREADLLVLGASAHSRLHDLILGGVTREALAGLAVPTLLAS